MTGGWVDLLPGTEFELPARLMVGVALVAAVVVGAACAVQPVIAPASTAMRTDVPLARERVVLTRGRSCSGDPRSTSA